MLGCTQKLLRALLSSLLLALSLTSTASASPQVFSGTPVSIRVDKSCAEKPSNDRIVFVFNEGMKSGWLYGKSIDPAQLRLLPTGKYEVVYAVVAHNHMQPGLMDLKAVQGGYTASIEDRTDDKELSKQVCFFEKLVVALKPIKSDSNRYMRRAKAIYQADMILLAGADLLYRQKDYKAAEANGRKALAILKRLNGKTNIETFDASTLVAWGMLGQRHFDEALKIIFPYRRALPRNPDVKKVYEQLRQKKKDRDEMIKFVPDSDDEDGEPMG
jgi:hypothetical protein